MKRKREQIIPYLLLTPVHFVLLVVVGLPTLYILWLSLNTSTWGTSLQFVGLENYRQLFTDPYFWRATLNTFLVVIGVVYIEMVLGLLLATFFIKGVLAKKAYVPSHFNAIRYLSGRWSFDLEDSYGPEHWYSGPIIINDYSQ